MGILSVMFYFIARSPSRTIVIPPYHMEKLRGARIAIVQNPSKDGWEAGVITDDVKEVAIKVRYENNMRTLDPTNEIKLENAALYWHLVDIIWIFLFPLFYLIS